MTDNQIARPAGVEVMTSGEVALVSIAGLVDEHFTGFGSLGPAVKSVIINTAGVTRMTSFGVRQWLNSMDALPKSMGALYLVNCPTFFVDQLNMVLNFGGQAQVLSVVAPYTCAACGVEAGEVVDVFAERASLVKGGVPEKVCRRCGEKLELDETPESYFSFVKKYAASSIDPAAAALLASLGLYHTVVDAPTEKPPRIIKLVRGSVTYFRITGTIGATFRARPFLVGAEGEIVIDLAELDRFDASGQREWRRLLKSLSSAAQVEGITLVDVGESLLTQAGDSFAIARNINVWSVLVPYRCADCGKTSRRSETLAGALWPLHFAEHVCSTCGGVTRAELQPEALAPLQRASTATPTASGKLIDQRAEVLSRERTDANVAQAGEGATASLGTGDTILGKYQIVRPLSAGGMAEVFLAKQVGIGGFEKPVALKRIQRQLLESRHLAIDMFLNEAKIAGRLMHPNIVPVLDVGEVGGALYLAMEYVRGKDLRDVVKHLRANRTKMPLGIACAIVRDVALALHHAYWSNDMEGKQLAVVHRDVSPHNVILSYDGAVKLLDFGVAMSAVTEQAESMIVGKWPYMSPEHTRNQQLDHRSDLFSLGVILYLLCTGSMPFAGNEPREIVRKIRAAEYQAVRVRAPELPPELDQLVSRLLAPNPDDRPQTGLEVVSALAEIARTQGLDTSAGYLADYLFETFGDSDEQMSIVELVRTEHGDSESQATKVLAQGSGASYPTRTSSVRRASRTSSAWLTPGTSSSLTPGANASLMSSSTDRPSQRRLAAVDVSVSLAWNSAQSSAPGSQSQPPVPVTGPLPVPAPLSPSPILPAPRLAVKPMAPSHWLRSVTPNTWIAIALIVAAVLAGLLIVRPV